MRRPTILPRIEQSSQPSSFRIYPGDIRPFMEIAVVAGRRKVIGAIAAAVLARNDMVHVKRQGVRRLRNATVLARFVRATPYSFRGCFHSYELFRRCALERKAGLGLYERQKVA